MKWARKYYQQKNINKGQKLTRNNIFSKRPGLEYPHIITLKFLEKSKKI